MSESAQVEAQAGEGQGAQVAQARTVFLGKERPLELDRGAPRTRMAALKSFFSHRC